MALSFSLAAAGLLVPSAGAAPKPTPATRSGGNLYLLQTEGGSISGSRLVLHGVQARVTSFTDRPRRSAGSPLTRNLAADWGSIFGTVAPNAALEVQGASRGEDVALLELRAPRYDAATRTLTFSVRRLSHTGDPALKEFDRRADGDAVKKFGAASLFVDSGGEAAVPVSVRFFGTTNGPVSVSFDGEIQYLGGVTDVSTPIAGNEVSDGNIYFASKTFTVFAGSTGGGMSADVFAEIVPSEGRLSGNAELQNGGTIELVIGESAPVRLSNGPFEIPLS
jgi:hypothetical protein